MTEGLTRKQWESALNKATPPTFGEVVSVLGDADMIDGAPEKLVEDALSAGVLDERETGTYSELVLTDPVSDQESEEDVEEAPPKQPTEGVDFAGVDTETYPRNLVENGHRWLLWQYREDRKIPRNPEWGRVDDEDYNGWKYAGNKDPRAWFEFEKAKRWAYVEPGLNLAYYLASPDRDEWDAENEDKYDWVNPEEHVPEEPHVGLLDFDYIRDPETGDVHDDAATIIEQFSHTFCEWSPSGTGAHALGGFRLPEGVDELKLDLATEEFPEAELEIYPGRRYTTITGDHIPGTAVETTGVQEAMDDLLEDHPTAVEAARSKTPDERPSELDSEPDLSREDVENLDETANIQDVFDAIQHTRPEDIRLRSPVTEERADGSKSRNPSWEKSKSGTRLAQVGDGFVYRDGMWGLDVLQVVALEERIITEESEYPEGERFWQAVDALRDRGAPIPEYSGGRVSYEELRETALDRGFVTDNELTPRRSTSGEVYQSLPKPAYERTVRYLEAEGRETGRLAHLDADSPYHDINLVEYADSNPYAEAETMLAACLRARGDGAVPENASPPRLALVAIIRETTGRKQRGEIRQGTRELAEAVYYEDLNASLVTPDDSVEIP